MNRAKQNGFAILELVLVLVIVGIVGLVAWRLVTVSGDIATNTATTNTVLPTPVSGVNSTKDLDTVSSELDSADIEGGDYAAQLESQSAF